jgi:hypothetical protein
MSRRLLAHVRRLLGPGGRSFYAQRLVLEPRCRRAMARWLARRRPRPPAAPPNARVIDAAAALERDGFHILAPPLSPQQLDDITRHLAQFRCRDPYRSVLGSFDPLVGAPPPTHVAFYPPEAIISCPHVFALANDPFILGVVAHALGCKPTVGYLTAWWSFKGHEAGEHAELFHRDVDDWRFFKLFVYLTDVDVGAGPHAFVSGSQATPRLLQVGRYSDDQVAAAFGADAVHSFTGARGTAFLEDTFGLHRGLPPRSRNRLVLQVVYSLGTLPYGPSEPTDASRLAADAQDSVTREPYVNRIYLRA